MLVPIKKTESIGPVFLVLKAIMLANSNVDILIVRNKEDFI